MTAGTLKAGAAVGAALHVSATAGTAMVLAGVIGVTSIPVVGGTSYLTNRFTQKTDGCVPEEYDAPDLGSGAKGAVEWAVMIANDDSFTYGGGDAAHKAGCYFCKTQDGKKRVAASEGHGYEADRFEKTYCCNPFCFSAYAHGAKDEKMLEMCENGGNGRTSWTDYGFTDLGHPDWSQLQNGDVIYQSSNGHYWMVADKEKDQLVEAASDGTHRYTAYNWSPNSIAVKEGAARRYASSTTAFRYKNSGQSAQPSFATPGEFVTASVRLGEACSDERGRVTGGRAGDQTGNEVKTSKYRSSGWLNAFRAKDPRARAAIAYTVAVACENNHIGYDQSDRKTFYEEAIKCDYDIARLTTDCETTCSELANVGIASAGLDHIPVSRSAHTGTLRPFLQNSPDFESVPIDENTLQAGDILISSGHTVIVISSPSSEEVARAALLNGKSAAYNALIADMTADDGCGGEMAGAIQGSTYVGKGMKEVTAANGEKYVILDFDLEQVKKLECQGNEQCYIYSIGYCDLVMGGKFRCDISGSKSSRERNMDVSYGKNDGSNDGLPNKIGGQQHNGYSQEAMRKKAIEEVKAGRPMIVFVQGNSYNVSTSGHWVAVIGWTASAGSDPKWDDLVCVDPAYLPPWQPGKDGLHAMKGFSARSEGSIALFDGWQPGPGQKKRQRLSKIEGCFPENSEIAEIENCKIESW